MLVTTYKGRLLKLAISSTMFKGLLKDLLGYFINTVDEE
jgi:hypothetical protein